MLPGGDDGGGGGGDLGGIGTGDESGGESRDGSGDDRHSCKTKLWPLFYFYIVCKGEFYF